MRQIETINVGERGTAPPVEDSKEPTKLHPSKPKKQKSKQKKSPKKKAKK